MMENPFEHNSKKLESGYYFDTRNNLICFYYSDEGDEQFSFFSSNRVYNRNTSTEVPLFMLPPNERDKVSCVEDLVEIKFSLLSNSSVLKDFEWLSSREALLKSFIEFLMREEKYLILEILKIYLDKKSLVVKS